MSKKILYLVDGTSLCYRSFFAIKLSTSTGFPTGAIYGFYQTLKKLIVQYNPLYMAVCFDVSRKTFRQEKFKEYKIQRPPLPEGLKAQFPIVKQLIKALGIKILEKKGFEADDVIASLCRGARQDDLSVVIVSSDKDFCQLIEMDKVSIYNYNKDKMYLKADFLEDYGFQPHSMVDYLSLAGDSADNIPGAKGIGKVGATKLIKKFSNLENIFSSLDKLPQKLRNILVENEKMVFLSRELVKLSFPDLATSWQDLDIKESDSKKVYEIFKNLEFRKLLKEVSAPSLNLDLDVKVGISKSHLQELTKEPIVLFIDTNKVFIFDKSKATVYKAEVNDLKGILEDSRIKKISYGFKSQLLSLEGIDIKGLLFDVKVAAYLLDSSLGDYSLSVLISSYLAEHFSDIPAYAYPYFIYQLYRLLLLKLKEQGLDRLFFDVEMPLITVLSGMQSRGVKVDVKILRALLRDVDTKIEKIRKNIFKICECEFNLNSPKQLRGILFDKLKIKPLKKTKTGYSTNEEVLDRLSLNYPVAGFILEYRQLNKLKTTYIEPLIEDADKNKGRLHTHFNQTVTQTGRLSSSSPNLQSIPAKGEFSLRLREAFISSFKDGYILSGDYSQIELRILAHLSGDKNLIDTFRQGLDIHSHTASLLFGKTMQEIDSSQRDVAKRVNFGIIYGMSSYGLSKELKISPLEAQNFIDDYFERYPGVKSYMDNISIQVEKTAFVKTILGRRRILKDINSSDIRLIEFARRQAINAPIQGSCADLVKIAMIRISADLRKENLKAKLTIQIHDELIFDVPENELEQVKVLAKKHMEGAIELIIPIKVKLKVGKNWGQMEEVK